MKYLTLQQIANITGMSQFTLRIYLQNFRFNQFVYGKKYLFNREFIDNFVEFLHIKRRHELAEDVKKKLLSAGKQELSV